MRERENFTCRMDAPGLSHIRIVYRQWACAQRGDLLSHAASKTSLGSHYLAVRDELPDFLIAFLMNSSRLPRLVAANTVCWSGVDGMHEENPFLLSQASAGANTLGVCSPQCLQRLNAEGTEENFNCCISRSHQPQALAQGFAHCSTTSLRCCTVLGACSIASISLNKLNNPMQTLHTPQDPCLGQGSNSHWVAMQQLKQGG